MGDTLRDSECQLRTLHRSPSSRVAEDGLGNVTSPSRGVCAQNCGRNSDFPIKISRTEGKMVVEMVLQSEAEDENQKSG